MLTTVFESFGYCRIGRLVAALKPINRINRLTTTDKTGRLMKISVHTIAVAFRILVARRSCWHRRRRIGGDRYRRSRLQLQLADSDHAIAGFDAADDFGAALDPPAGAHEGANGGDAGLAVIVFFLRDEKHRVPVKRIVDRGFRYADDRRLFGKHYGGRGEHARFQDTVGVLERALNADVAGLRGDLRFDRGDLAFEGAARIGIHSHANGLPDLELRAVLLRHREIGIQLRQIGQRHDLCAGGEILAYLDVPDAEFTIEWSADELLRNDGLGPGDSGIGLVIRRLRLIDGRLRSELARGELLGAVQRQLRDRRLRLEVRQIRLFRSIEQLDERVSGLHGRS